MDGDEDQLKFFNEKGVDTIILLTVSICGLLYFAYTRKRFEEEVSKLRSKISSKDEEFSERAGSLEKELQSLRDQLETLPKDRDKALKDKEALLEETQVQQQQLELDGHSKARRKLERKKTYLLERVSGFEQQQEVQIGVQVDTGVTQTIDPALCSTEVQTDLVERNVKEVQTDCRQEDTKNVQNAVTQTNEGMMEYGTSVDIGVREQRTGVEKEHNDTAVKEPCQETYNGEDEAMERNKAIQETRSIEFMDMNIGNDDCAVHTDKFENDTNTEIHFSNKIEAVSKDESFELNREVSEMPSSLAKSYVRSVPANDANKQFKTSLNAKSKTSYPPEGTTGLNASDLQVSAPSVARQSLVTAPIDKDADGKAKIEYKTKSKKQIHWDGSNANVIAQPKSDLDMKVKVDACLELIDYLKLEKPPSGVVLDKSKISLSPSKEYRLGHEFERTGEILGKGNSAGDIVVVTDKKTGQEHAYKTMMISYFRKEEVKCWEDMSDSGCVPGLYLFKIENNKLHMHMEILRNAKTLRSILDEHMAGFFNSAENRSLLKLFSLYVLDGALEAVTQMLNKGWVHRDLHGFNFMVQLTVVETLGVKVLDFGLAQKLEGYKGLNHRGFHADIGEIVRLFSALYTGGLEFDNVLDLRKNWKNKLTEVTEMMNVDDKNVIFCLVDAALKIDHPNQVEEYRQQVKTELGKAMDNEQSEKEIMRKVVAILFPKDFQQKHQSAENVAFTPTSETHKMLWEKASEKEKQRRDSADLVEGSERDNTSKMDNKGQDQQVSPLPPDHSLQHNSSAPSIIPPPASIHAVPPPPPPPPLPNQVQPNMVAVLPGLPLSNQLTHLPPRLLSPGALSPPPHPQSTALVTQEQNTQLDSADAEGDFDNADRFQSNHGLELTDENFEEDYGIKLLKLSDTE